MNYQKIIKELQIKYPNKKIVRIPNDNPTEIICELGLGKKGEGVAVSIIDKSIPHYHKKMTESYKILKGTLQLYKNGKKFRLREGDSIKINPCETHNAIGNETWIEVISTPPWTKEDHFIA